MSFKILEEDSETNLQEIADRSGYNISEILEEIQSLVIKGLISFKIKVREDDVYQISPRTWGLLLREFTRFKKSKKYTILREWRFFLRMMKKTVKAIALGLRLNPGFVKVVLGYFLMENFIELVPTEKKMI